MEEEPKTLEEALTMLKSWRSAYQVKLDEIAAMNTEINNQARELAALRAEVARFRQALQIIAGEKQCLNNLMSNVDIARAALASPAAEKPPHSLSEARRLAIQRDLAAEKGEVER